MSVMKTLLFSAIVATTLGTVASAAADDYPTRPITIIAPFPAGGPSDVVVRILSEPMRIALGQPVIIENVTGAGGNIGVGRAARSDPDGYTILVGQFSTHVVNPVTYKLPYNVVDDFEPVALIAVTPTMIIAKKSFPAGDIKEFVAWLKANPDKAMAATVGAAGGAQVAAVYFQQKTGTRFGFVPYRGGPPAMQDLVSGQVDLMFDQAANAINQVKAGRIKAYAVMARERWHLAPDIPTIEEAGLPGLQVAYWHGIWAPKGTPKPIIAKLNAAIVAALADPAVRERFAIQGQDIWPANMQTPEALAAWHRAEIAKWTPIIQAAGLKAE
jgi:tripartite-type tricarboxylate transporter receptor subunit TctC